MQYDSISRLQINNLYTNSIDQKFINVIIGDILIPSCGCNTNKKMNKLIEIFNLEIEINVLHFVQKYGKKIQTEKDRKS